MEITFGIIGGLVGITGLIYAIYRNKKIDKQQIPSTFNDGFKKPFIDHKNNISMYLKDNSQSGKLNVDSVYLKKRFLQIWKKVHYSFNQMHYEGDYRLDIETRTEANNFKLKIKTNFGKLIIPFKNVWKYHQAMINKMK